MRVKDPGPRRKTSTNSYNMLMSPAVPAQKGLKNVQHFINRPAKQQPDHMSWNSFTSALSLSGSKGPNGIFARFKPLRSLFPSALLFAMPVSSSL